PGTRSTSCTARVACGSRIEVRVEILQLVPDLGLGLTADLLAAPLPIRAEAERDDTTPPAITALVVPAVTALSRVVTVDAHLRRAAAPGVRHAGSLRLGSRLGSHQRSRSWVYGR